MTRVTTRRPTLRITAGGPIRRPDTLAVEEPLEIRLDGEPLTVTMRTPGDDIDLVHGFLFSENLIEDAQDIVSARYCAGTGPDGQNTYNLLDIRLRTAVPVRPRAFVTSSSCGVCGKTALDEVTTRTRHPLRAPAAPLVDTDLLARMPRELRSRQKVFDTTGGLHAAGLFSATGELLAVREDVGRHNAVDKVIGWALQHRRLPAPDLILVVSSRASFELVQKAVMAGIPLLAVVSAPSSLAVDLAGEAGMTLVGFLRGDTMNIYTGAERIRLAGAPDEVPDSGYETVAHR
ncbi:formate dehydrogenase accessory sulfurtransferase FdhD [Nocardia stercoris]|uniref:Sulfur carrier protein FdhD n=1 Tax=Nocardia stercoris TaxID=2483361 RepID=A0A3M2L8B6_9NOCA|nr:formate dehydrogenase accessory sulfurtransferase FdhD [Nocardia stercoris]RMI32165.1 formate dehydrogenase accessory sulfurtransferase FdhD [Nocardia stercoris]